jgi:hypothetical protein
MASVISICKHPLARREASNDRTAIHTQDSLISLGGRGVTRTSLSKSACQARPLPRCTAVRKAGLRCSFSNACFSSRNLTSPRLFRNRDVILGSAGHYYDATCKGCRASCKFSICYQHATHGEQWRVVARRTQLISMPAGIKPARSRQRRGHGDSGLAPPDCARRCRVYVWMIDAVGGRTAGAESVQASFVAVERAVLLRACRIAPSPARIASQTWGCEAHGRASEEGRRLKGSQ